MKDLIEQGSFIAREELWFYRRVRDCDLPNFYLYLSKFYKEHGFDAPPAYGDIYNNFKNGHYDNSHVIFDSNGVLNACSIIHDIKEHRSMFGKSLHCWGSELYLEGKRSTVAPTFTLSMWFQVYGGTHCFFEASLPFVSGKFIEYGFRPMKLKEDKDDWVVAYDSIANPYRLYQLGKIRENYFD